MLIAFCKQDCFAASCSNGFNDAIQLYNIADNVDMCVSSQHRCRTVTTPGQTFNKHNLARSGDEMFGFVDGDGTVIDFHVVQIDVNNGTCP